MSDQPVDDGLTRTAIRNLRMYAEGFDVSKLKAFKVALPEVPEAAIEYYRTASESGRIAEIEKSFS